MLAFVKDEGRGHVIRQEADLHFLRDELHGDVIGHFVDGDSGVPVHFPCDAVQETFLQPFPGLRHADRGAGLLVALQGRGSDAGMDGSVVGAHVILKEPVELIQRGDGIHVQGVEPCLFQRSELPLDLGLGGSVTYFCM